MLLVPDLPPRDFVPSFQHPPRNLSLAFLQQIAASHPRCPNNERSTTMTNIQFIPGKETVISTDIISRICGNPCGFAETASILHRLKNKGYAIRRVYPFSFTVILNDKDEARNMQEDIKHAFLDVLTGKDEELRKIHKAAERAFLTAMQAACQETWQLIFPGLDKEDVRVELNDGKQILLNREAKAEIEIEKTL